VVWCGVVWLIFGGLVWFFLWGEQRKFIEAWAYQVVREPRMVALLEESAVNLLSKAESILKDTSSESQRQTFTLVSCLPLLHPKL
jgi:hypothetical protein